MTARPAMLLGVVVLFAAGCGGGGAGAESTAPPPPPPTAESGPPDPGDAMDEFVAAAAAKDAEAMWARLTPRSRKRLGPSLEDFRTGAAARLEAQLAPLAGPKARRVLSERITLDVGVAAVAAPGAAFAAALRLEADEWLLELGGPIRIRPLRPDPGETVDSLTQVAAEFKASSPILEAGLWLDGTAVPAKSGGTSPSYITVFAEVSKLALGPHSMVAFVVAGEEASALAWAFRAEPEA